MDQNDVEMGQQPGHVVAAPRKWTLSRISAWSRNVSSRGAVRAVAEDQEVDVAADHLQQVGGPDGVLDPLLRPEPADQPDQPGAGREAQLDEQLLPRDGRGRGRRDAVGDHLELLGRQAVGRRRNPARPRC